MKIFPSWRYHRVHEPRIVRSEAEDLALGADWAHSPAAFIDEIKHFDPEVGFSKPVPAAPDPAIAPAPVAKRKRK